MSWTQFSSSQWIRERPYPGPSHRPPAHMAGRPISASPGCDSVFMSLEDQTFARSKIWMWSEAFFCAHECVEMLSDFSSSNLTVLYLPRHPGSAAFPTPGPGMEPRGPQRTRLTQSRSRASWVCSSQTSHLSAIRPAVHGSIPLAGLPVLGPASQAQICFLSSIAHRSCLANAPASVAG